MNGVKVEKVKKKGLLSGIGILDLADEKASFCSKLLADMGARVIKVEKPGGDRSRLMGPFRGGSPHPDRSLSFYYSNTNKFGITLNLECDTGKELFARLIPKTDVIVESFPPGHLEGLGLGYNDLSKINPGLILASVTGFGRTGPKKNYKSCDLVASAFGGQTYVSGSPSFTPIKPPGEQSYFTGSLFASVGILLALRGRTMTGKGEHIDISLQEAAAGTLDHVITRYFHEKVIAGRHGNRHWNGFFWILKCKDGFIHINPFENWNTLVELLESEGMAKDLFDEKYRDRAYWLENADHVAEVLEEWTATHTTHEIFELGQLMRFPWAPVCSPKDVLESPQLKARGFFREPEGPGTLRGLQCPGLPYRFSEGFTIPFKEAPRIGEDNQKIYGQVLGLSGEDIQRLSSRGVI